MNIPALSLQNRQRQGPGTPFEIIFGVKGLGQPLMRFLFSLLMRGRSGLHNFRLTAAVRSVMANVTLKLSIGTFSIEVSGPAKYAEKKLEDLIAKYLSSSIKSGVSDSTSSTVSSLQLSAGKKKRSPSEILKRAGNQADRALLLGYYLEKMDAQPSFTTTELKELGKQAKYSFTNISDSVAGLVGRGLMMSAGEKESHRAYTLTATGEEYAESLISNP